MAIEIGGMQSIGTGGMWVPEGQAGSIPGAPTLSVVNDGDGDAVTATIDGDASVTHTLYYRQAGDDAWTAGETRVGDGDIAQAGLEDDTWYEFICVSASGSYYSLPSLPVQIAVTSGSSTVLQIESVVDVENRGREMLVYCREVT